MSYSSASLNLVHAGFAGQTPNKWSYRSTDAASTVDGAGYITDALAKGMKVGDLVEVQDTDNAYLTSVHVVVSVNATTGVGDLSDGTTIGSSTNSD